MRIKKLYQYMLVKEEVYRVGTADQINQMVKEVGFPVWIKTLASSTAVQDWICEGAGEIPENNYEVSDGTLDILGEEDDYEIVHISNKILPIFKNVV